MSASWEDDEEEEIAGGEILPQDDTAADGIVEELIEKEGRGTQQQQILEGEDNDEAEEDDEKKKKKKPYKPIPLSNVARLLDANGELIEDDEDDDGGVESSSSILFPPPDILQLEELVTSIESRGYNNGYGLDSTHVLKQRLKRIFFSDGDEDDDNNDGSDNPVINWLTRPLFQALLEGPTSAALQAKLVPLNINKKRRNKINEKSSSSVFMEGQSLLHWVVQWKLLQIQCGWKGHDDIVDLVLKAGADPNAALSNGCTPIFFAVKYGTVDTCRLLVEAGANPLHTDCRHQTCLRNALPQASPYVLKYLLKHIKNPANETYTTELYNGSKIKINVLDVMVTEFVTPHPDVSWATLGMPSAEDYAISMLLFLKRGIQISPHYPDVTFFLGEYLQGNIQNVKRLYYTRKVVDLMLGQWLPLSIRQDIQELTLQSQQRTKQQKRQDDENDQDRRQATTSTTTAAATTTLQSTSNDIATKTTTTSTRNEQQQQQQQRYDQLSQLSLKQLQFECEARNLVIAQQDNKDHCIQALVADWDDFTLPNGRGEDLEEEDDNDDGGDSGSRIMAELSLSHTMISENNYLWVASSQGSVMIPITIKGIPVFALLSTTSPYTVVSPRLVQQYGFELNSNLQTTLYKPLKFVRAEDDEQKAGNNSAAVNNNPNLAPALPPRPKMMTAPQIHITAVQDFQFTLGQKRRRKRKSGGKKQSTTTTTDDDDDDDNDDEPIVVKLPSAVQVCDPQTNDWPVGIVLGLDFLQSAAWVQMSVEVDLEVCLGRTVALLTGGGSFGAAAEGGMEFDLIEPRRANFVEEDLRYYSRDDGKLFWTPLWHIKISKEDCCLSLGQYMQSLLPYPTSKKQKQKQQQKNNNDTFILRSKGITKCACCCREFPFVPPNKQRDFIHWILTKPIPKGMIQCSSARDKEEEEENVPTFYCDENCRQQALQHRGGAELSSHMKSDEGMTFKKKMYMIVSLILFMGLLVNTSWMTPAGEQPTKTTTTLTPPPDILDVSVEAEHNTDGGTGIDGEL